MKTETVRDSIDIEDILEGTIPEVIAKLTELHAKYPDGVVELGTRMEYGETYLRAELSYERPKEPIEKELEMWEAKAAHLDALRREARAFTSNDVPYPRADEIEALRKELGFFAMAPMRGSFTIYNGEILVHDMMRGARRRDGTFVLRMMMGLDEEYEKRFEAMDAEYRA